MIITKEWLEEKKSAWNKLNYAIKKNRMTKPLICSDCGKLFTKREIHGHHFDYSKPYDVKWLCIGCHDKLETLLGNRKNFKNGYDKRRVTFKKGHKCRSGCFKKGYDIRRNLKGKKSNLLEES